MTIALFHSVFEPRANKNCWSEHGPSKCQRQSRHRITKPSDVMLNKPYLHQNRKRNHSKEMIVPFTESYFYNISDHQSMQDSCWESLKGIIGKGKGMAFSLRGRCGQETAQGSL